MKTYHRIHAALYGKPWAILPETHRSMQHQLSRAIQRADSMTETVAEVDDSNFGAATSRIDGFMRAGRVAIVPVSGIIGKRLSSMDIECGGCDMDAVLDGMYSALSNNGIDSIVMDFDTPGGTVTGIQEAVRAIQAISAQKTVYGYSETMCCSAGMWLASACERFYASGSSTVGSVGVYCAVLDATASMAQDGLAMNTFQSGDLKTMGASWKAMTDEQKSIMQADVDRIGEAFRAQMNSRWSVSPEAMRGQSMDGSEGLEAGMVDGLYDSMDDFLDDLNKEDDE